MKRNIESDSVQRILDAAIEVFAEVGYAGARMDEIANRASINKAALYYHIGGKKKLYDFALTQLLGESVERIIQNVQEASTPEEKLRRYIHTLAENISQNPAIAPIMLREIAVSGKNFSLTFLTTLLRLLATLTEIFDDGEQQGIFVPIPPLIVHFMIVGTVLLFRVKETLTTQNTTLAEALKLAEHQFAGQATDELGQLIMKNIKLFSRDASMSNIAEEIEQLILKAVKK